MAAFVEHHEDAQPREEEEEKTCSICSDILMDGAAVHGLPCAHVFHLECLDAYGNARGQHFERLPCPTCKKVPVNLAQQGLRQRQREAMEMQMQAAPAIDVDAPAPEADPPMVPLAEPPLAEPPLAEPPLAEPPLAEQAVPADPPLAEPPHLVIENPPDNDTDLEDSDNEALQPLRAEGGAAPAAAKAKAKGKAKAKAKAKGKAKAADVAMPGPDMEDPGQAPADVPGAKGKAKAKANARGDAVAADAEAHVAVAADMQVDHEVPPEAPVAKAKAKGKSKAKAKANAAAVVDAVEEAAEEAAEEANPDIDAELLPLPNCFYCGDQCEHKQYLLKSKKRNEFMCFKCNNKRIVLYKAGEFPDTSALSNDDAKAFWSQMKNIQDKGALLQLARSASLTKYNREETENKEGSEWLPASVWATRGFDADRIVQLSKPENIKEDAVLGTCYRLEISSSYNKRKWGHAFQDQAAVVGPSAGERGQAPAGGQANNVSDLSLKEKMQVQLKRLAELKEQAKKDIVDRKQLLCPGKKEMTALTKMEGELKVAKLPEHMQGSNPIETVKSKLSKIMQDIELHNDDADKIAALKLALNKAVSEAALTRKMMRPFC